MGRTMLNLVVTLGLLVALGLSALLPQAAQAADLEAVLRLYYQAVDRGDLPAALAAFTDDAVYIFGACSPALPCTGKAQIQGSVQGGVGIKASYGVLSSSVSGSTVTALVASWNLNIQGAGVQQVIYNATVTFQGEKIARYVAALDLSDEQSLLFSNFQRVNQAFLAGAAAIQRGDTVGALTLFTDNAVITGGPLCRPAACSGKQAIQEEIERRIADHSTLTHVPGNRPQISGDIRTESVEIRADSIRAAGIERILVDVTTEVQGNKIASERIVPDASDPQTAAFLAAQAAAPAPGQPSGLPQTGSGGLRTEAGWTPFKAAAVAGTLLLSAVAALWIGRRRQRPAAALPGR